jgi:hypothetical protein
VSVASVISMRPVADWSSDVATQSTSPGWTLGSWAEYYNTPESKRDKIRNVISLEVTGTPLAEQITPPRLVREIDWVEHVWPAGKKGKGQFPKVQLYCLMSVARCWTVCLSGLCSQVVIQMFTRTGMLTLLEARCITTFYVAPRYIWHWCDVSALTHRFRFSIL